MQELDVTLDEKESVHVRADLILNDKCQRRQAFVWFETPAMLSVSIPSINDRSDDIDIGVYANEIKIKTGHGLEKINDGTWRIKC
jgi:hypothetical protein